MSQLNDMIVSARSHAEAVGGGLVPIADYPIIGHCPSGCSGAAVEGVEPPPMSRVDLSNIDLNLLKAFDALCHEGSVTRAAARLSIGQPAMSHALGRLRQLLDDELFVKTPRGMEPTARAQTLMKPVRAALDQIARALNDGYAFDPRTDLSVFRVGMLDFVAAGLLPGLLTNVNEAAPGVSFELHTIPLQRLNAQLDEGLLDMVVSFSLPDAEWQRHEVLLRETHRCIFNERLVQVTDPITFDEFLTVPHIAIAPQGEEVTPVDTVLQSLGKTRRVLASTTDFLLAAYVLHDMAAVATVPACFAERCRSTAGLHVSPLPFDMPECEIAVSWHARDEGNVRHQWLRDATVWAMREMLGRTPTIELTPGGAG